MSLRLKYIWVLYSNLYTPLPCASLQRWQKAREIINLMLAENQHRIIEDCVLAAEWYISRWYLLITMSMSRRGKWELSIMVEGDLVFCGHADPQKLSSFSLASSPGGMVLGMRLVSTLSAQGTLFPFIYLVCLWKYFSVFNRQEKLDIMLLSWIAKYTSHILLLHNLWGCKCTHCCCLHVALI